MLVLVLKSTPIIWFGVAGIIITYNLVGVGATIGSNRIFGDKFEELVSWSKYLVTNLVNSNKFSVNFGQNHLVTLNVIYNLSIT